MLACEALAGQSFGEEEEVTPERLLMALKAVLAEYRAVVEGEWGGGKPEDDWARDLPAAQAAQALIAEIEEAKK